jgi:hypothetical protein
MTYKCNWPGCAATTECRITDGWQWGGYDPELVPGLPETAFLCSLHKRAYEALEIGPPAPPEVH